MPRRVKGPDGIVRLFPDDATDAEISEALSEATSPPVQRRGLGDARLEVAQGPIDDAGNPMRQPGKIEQWFETQLRPMLEKVAHPQTISEIAGLLIPAGYGGTIAAGAEKVAQTTQRAMPTGEQAARGGLELVKGILHPKTVADRAIKYAEGRLNAPATQAAAPVVEAAEAITPAAAKASPYLPNKALQAAKDAFEAIGETPLKAEASNAMELIRRGKSPEEAIRIVMGNRPSGRVSTVPNGSRTVPANIGLTLTDEEAALAHRLIARGKTQQEAVQAILDQRELLKVPGAVTSAEANAGLDLRHARGEIKTPSAPTARARRQP